MQITRGKIQSAQKVILYGPEGIGKSTFAAQFPNPLFIDTEGSTKHMDVARMPKPTSWMMLLQQVQYVRNNPGLCGSLVIDTADWAEQLCITEICAKAQKTGIEDFGYGKGYVYLAEEFGKLLNLLEEIVERGIHVCFTAHAKMRKFEQPDEMGAYDRWEMKLSKHTSPLLKEWADMVLFANYKTYVVNVDNQGAQKGKNKAQGGTRVMHTCHHPCWDAKNRQGLSDELPLSFSSIAHCIPDIGGQASTASTAETAPAAQEAPVATSAPEPSKAADATPSLTQTEAPATDTPDEIPPALADLMAFDGISMEEVQAAVAIKGYYPQGTPFDKYDAGFVQGVLIGAWPKVRELALEVRAAANEETPF